MRQKIRSLFAGFLILCLLTVLFPASSFAADDDDEAQRWNIMLVIDCSDSLRKNPSSTKADSGSDPDGLRFEAVDSFIDTLQNDGHYVGAILFRANMTSDTSDEAMLKGIKLDTWENGPVALQGNKETLKAQIRTTTHNDLASYNAETDIGTAMLVAEQHCEEATAQNGLPSAIFLFTDGQIACEVPAVTTKAKENMDEAVQLAANNNIKVCGVYLNCNGSKADATEWFQNKIAAANGISSTNTSKYFIEINDANDIQDAIDNFLTLLGYSLPESYPITGSADFTFRIPGTGVDEATLRLKSADGSELPSGLSVTVTKPDNTELEVAQRTTMGKTYEIIKIYNEDLQSGRWNVHVDLPEDCQVNMVYQPIFSTSFDCDFETSVEEAKICSGMNVVVNAFIEINGIKQSGSAAYNEYDYKLVLVDDATGEEIEYPLQMNASGEVEGNVDLSGLYSTYNAYVKFSCDEISKISPLHRWNLTDHTPTAADAEVKGTYGLFGGTSTTVTLPASDDEDGTNLSVSLSGDDCNIAAITVNGIELTIDNAKVGSGTITYRVTDTQGAYAEAQLTVSMQNVTVRNAIIIAVAVLIVLFIIWWLLTHRTTPPANSECSIKFDIESSNGGFGNAKTELDLKLVPPGRSGKYSDTLYNMLKADIDNSCGEIQTVCQQKNIDYNTVNSFINARASALKAVKIKCVSGRINIEGKNKKVAKLHVKGSGVNTILYNEAVNLQVGDVPMTIGYYVNDGSGSLGGFDNASGLGFQMEKKQSAGAFDTPNAGSSNGFGGFGGFGGFDNNSNTGFGGNTENNSGNSFGGFGGNTDNNFGSGFGGSDNGFGGFGESARSSGNTSSDSNSGSGFGGFGGNSDSSSNTGFGGFGSSSDSNANSGFGGFGSSDSNTNSSDFDI